MLPAHGYHGLCLTFEGSAKKGKNMQLFKMNSPILQHEHFYNVKLNMRVHRYSTKEFSDFVAKFQVLNVLACLSAKNTWLQW